MRLPGIEAQSWSVLRLPTIKAQSWSVLLVPKRGLEFGLLLEGIQGRRYLIRWRGMSAWFDVSSASPLSHRGICGRREVIVLWEYRFWITQGPVWNPLR